MMHFSHIQKKYNFCNLHLTFWLCYVVNVNVGLVLLHCIWSWMLLSAIIIIIAIRYLLHEQERRRELSFCEIVNESSGRRNGRGRPPSRSRLLVAFSCWLFSHSQFPQNTRPKTKNLRIFPVRLRRRDDHRTRNRAYDYVRDTTKSEAVWDMNDWMSFWACEKDNEKKHLS
jgi:hypothetical protein